MSQFGCAKTLAFVASISVSWALLGFPKGVPRFLLYDTFVCILYFFQSQKLGKPYLPFGFLSGFWQPSVDFHIESKHVFTDFTLTREIELMIRNKPEEKPLRLALSIEFALEHTITECLRPAVLHRNPRTK